MMTLCLMLNHLGAGLGGEIRAPRTGFPGVAAGRPSGGLEKGGAFVNRSSSRSLQGLGFRVRVLGVMRRRAYRGRAHLLLLPRLLPGSAARPETANQKGPRAATRRSRPDKRPGSLWPCGPHAGGAPTTKHWESRLLSPRRDVVVLPAGRRGPCGSSEIRERCGGWAQEGGPGTRAGTL